MTTFPRTVLVETFTGVWCIHCPAESQALYAIDRNSSPTTLAISELHACAFAKGQGPCLENYVPSDTSSDVRGIFYNVCGYPDVFFDGQHDACGASNSESQMQTQYENAIRNASLIPGNVSITQSATISYGSVVQFANITSGIDGTYNVVTYLMEYIGKQGVSNGYGPHSIGWIVRESLRNHPVNLTSGSTTPISVSRVLNTSWNPHNLSVVTLVQQNSTKIVENANMAPVTSVLTAVTGNQTSAVEGTNLTITVHVTNASTHAPVSGATVAFYSTVGGTFTPPSGTTAMDGSFSATFTAPPVLSPSTDVLTAQVSSGGLFDGEGSFSVLVNPLVLSHVPTGLAVAPADAQVALNWSAPPSGGLGATYHIYRSISPVAAFSPVGVSTTTDFVDTAVTSGLSYWYKISTQDSAGFSANTTVIPATGLSVDTVGLPTSIGWWITIDSVHFISPTSASLYLYLPSGVYTYTFGPDSYAYTTASDPTGSVTSTGAALQVSASFQPRYATLQGSVSPASAVVTLNGAPITVNSAGSFSELRVAGSYTLNVTSSGYRSNSTVVLLTPGNTTTRNVTLERSSSPSGPVTTSSGGLTSDEVTAIIVIIAVIGVAAVAGTVVAMSRRGRRGGSPPEPPQEEL